MSDRENEWLKSLWDEDEVGGEFTDQEMEDIWNDPLLKEAAELLAMMDRAEELEPTDGDLQKIEENAELADDLPEVLQLHDDA